MQLEKFLSDQKDHNNQTDFLISLVLFMVPLGPDICPLSVCASAQRLIICYNSSNLFFVVQRKHPEARGTFQMSFAKRSNLHCSWGLIPHHGHT